MALKPNPAYWLFVYGLQAQSGCYLFKWADRNKKKKNILWYMKSIWNSEISGSTKFDCNIAHSLCIVYFCPTVEELSSCDRDHMWPRKRKTFTRWLIIEKACCSAVFIKMLIFELQNIESLSLSPESVFGPKKNRGALYQITARLPS